MVMKVWYLQVIWLVRDSIIKKVDIAGKIMIKWLQISGKKEPNNKLRMPKENNQRKIKKLLMLFPMLVERILKLMLQRLKNQRKQRKKKVLKMLAKVMMPKRKKLKVMQRLMKAPKKKLRMTVLLLKVVSQIFQSLIHLKPLLR